MKILFLGKYDFSDVAGGIERYVHLLRLHFPKSVETINLVSNVHNKTEKTDTTIKTRRLGVIASTSIAPSLPFIFLKTLQQENPDIIHVQFPDPMAHLACLFNKNKKIKIVISWHSNIVRQHHLKKLYQPFLNIFLRKVDALIVHSKELVQSPQIAAISKDKIHIIPIGVPAPEIKDQNLREKLPEGFILFTHGRHVTYKGFDYLIKSLKLLPPIFHLYIGGIGPETENLNKLITDLNLNDRIHLVGFIPDDLLGSYINACDIYCFPSISANEAFGIAQVEAMLLGKPVVGFELNNGTTFVNKDHVTGIVVENKNIKAYADALITLLNDNKLRTILGKNAQKRAMRLFSIDTMVRSTLKIYEDVLKN